MGHVDDVRIEGVVPVFIPESSRGDFDVDILPMLRIGVDLLQQHAGGQDILPLVVFKALHVDPDRKGAGLHEGVVGVGNGLGELAVITVQLESRLFGFIGLLLLLRIGRLAAGTEGKEQGTGGEKERKLSHDQSGI